MKLAENLLVEIREEDKACELDFVPRANALSRLMIIENPFFMQSLWWGIKLHCLNEVILYFEGKVEDSSPQTYRVVPEDYQHFLTLEHKRED